MKFLSLALMALLPLTLSESTSLEQNDNSWQLIPPALREFIAQHNPLPQNILQNRQHGVGGPDAAAAATEVTQMSPTTTYEIGGQRVIYTQKFQPTPDPWAGPVNGEIGLGSIKGTVGTVRG